MAVTEVLAFPIHEASLKTRKGPPVDAEKDYELPVWAGVVPLELRGASSIADEKNQAGVPVPAYLKKLEVYTRRLD